MSIYAAYVVKLVHFLIALSSVAVCDAFSVGIKYGYTVYIRIYMDIYKGRTYKCLNIHCIYVFTVIYPLCIIVKQIWNTAENNCSEKWVHWYWFLYCFLLFYSLSFLFCDMCRTALRQWFPARGTRPPEDTSTVAKGCLERLKRSSAYLCVACVLYPLTESAVTPKHCIAGKPAEKSVVSK